MIGIVNQAFQDYVREHHDPVTWQRIAQRVETDMFVESEDYDDDLTAELANAIAAEVGLDVEDVLRQVGEHFGRICLSRRFGALLDAAGSTYLGFLRKLPDLQTRFGLIYPDTRPPRFEVLEEGPDSMTIVHETTREGLAPLFAGTLAGLASAFGVDASVSFRRGRSECGIRHEYLVRWTAEETCRPNSEEACRPHSSPAGVRLSPDH